MRVARAVLVASSFTLLAIEGDAVIVFDCAAKDVQGAADGEVDAAVTGSLDGFEIGEGVGAAGVGTGDGRMGGEILHKGKVNAGLLAFHIHGVHEVFSTTVGEGFQGRLVDRQLGELLPAVDDDPVFVVALAAGKVEHEAFAADGFHEASEACSIKTAFAENP